MSAMDNRQRFAAHAALFLAVVLYFIFQVLPLLKAQGGNANDFKHIYLGALLLDQGANPYDAETLRETASLFTQEDWRFRTILPYVYLPFTGTVLLPLSKLRFATAVIAWGILNHLLIIAGAAIAAWASGWKYDWRAITLLAAALVFNYSIFRQNNAGQLNAVLFAGSAILYAGIVREWKPWALGLIAAFLIMFKITPGIFLIYFLLTRRWREAAWTMLFAAIMMGLTLLLYGWHVHTAFLPLLAEMGYGKSTWAQYDQAFWRDPFNQSMNSFLHHLMVPWPGFSPAITSTAGLANALTMIFALAVIGIMAWRLWQAPGNTAPAFSLAVLASLLVPSLMWDHYLVQALLPAVLLWNAAPEGRRSIARAVIATCVVLFSLGVKFDAGFIHFGILEAGIEAISGASPRIPIVRLPDWPVAREILMSLKLWGAIALFAVACWTSIYGQNATVKHPHSEVGGALSGKP